MTIEWKGVERDLQIEKKAFCTGYDRDLRWNCILFDKRKCHNSRNWCHKLNRNVKLIFLKLIIWFKEGIWRSGLPCRIAVIAAFQPRKVYKNVRHNISNEKMHGVKWNHDELIWNLRVLCCGTIFLKVTCYHSCKQNLICELWILTYR